MRLLGGRMLKQEGEKLYTDTGVYLGDVLPLEDGFFYWWPHRESGGCLSEGNLIEIAAHLRRMNAAWDMQVLTDPSISGKVTGWPVCKHGKKAWFETCRDCLDAAMEPPTG